MLYMKHNRKGAKSIAFDVTTKEEAYAAWKKRHMDKSKHPGQTERWLSKYPIEHFVFYTKECVVKTSTTYRKVSV